MAAPPRPVRVAVYGTGHFANQTHLPNLAQLAGVQVVAATDPDAARLQSTAARFGIPRTYADPHRMLAAEEIDILFSIVPAFARTDVEAAAAARGIHLFSEKPQAITMAVARRIDAAVRQAGVLSTVGFRERYRPLFQEARRLLQGREVVHARFQAPRGLPARLSEIPADQRDSWHHRMDRSGGPAFDWGVHAVDYVRFMTGLDVAVAQAFYHHPPDLVAPLSCSLNLRLANGATFTMVFVSAGADDASEAPFTVYYRGGRLALWMYDRIEVDDEVAYRAEEFDPWLAQDRAFVEAVRANDGSGLLNDYHDGLQSLAPVLAGWESARRGGQPIDVPAFIAA